MDGDINVFLGALDKGLKINQIGGLGQSTEIPFCRRALQKCEGHQTDKKIKVINKL